MSRFDPALLNRIVVKVGSSSIVKPDGMVRLGFLGKLATTIVRLYGKGTMVVLVSSGAIALGAKRLGFSDRPTQITDKQACASVGQTELMTLYQTLFSALSFQAGQVLLTRDGLMDRRRYLNARETLLRLMEMNIIPIINENDSVSVDEIKFGDNDELSSLTAGLIDGDLLVLMTDVDGLYKAGNLVEQIDHDVHEFIDQVEDQQGVMGQGGMQTKLEAAGLCCEYGIPSMIIRGNGSVLDKALLGEKVGTYIKPKSKKMLSRDRWLANAAMTEGVLLIDAGAAKAVALGHKSLLPKGIDRIDGDFLRGGVVSLMAPDGKEIGRGIVRYSSEDLEKILGCHGSDIELVLGFTFGAKVVHQNDIVLFSS